jgi:hypothetical protein
MMERLGMLLAVKGYILRSGAAYGSDAAFEKGCDQRDGKKEIFLPWLDYNKHVDTGFYPGPLHFDMAKTLHPIWNDLPPGVQKLHARNVGQILGSNLKEPVDFVVCWTRDGCEKEENRTSITGGTGTAIALASRRGIPVFNLRNTGRYDDILAFIKE